MTEFFLADSDATELLGRWLAAPAAGRSNCAATWVRKSTTARALLRACVQGRSAAPHPGRALSAGQWR